MENNGYTLEVVSSRECSTTIASFIEEIKVFEVSRIPAFSHTGAEGSRHIYATSPVFFSSSFPFVFPLLCVFVAWCTSSDSLVFNLLHLFCAVHDFASCA